MATPKALMDGDVSLLGVEHIYGDGNIVGILGDVFQGDLEELVVGPYEREPDVSFLERLVAFVKKGKNTLNVSYEFLFIAFGTDPQGDEEQKSNHENRQGYCQTGQSTEPVQQRRNVLSKITVDILQKFMILNCTKDIRQHSQRIRTIEFERSVIELDKKSFPWSLKLIWLFGPETDNIPDLGIPLRNSPCICSWSFQKRLWAQQSFFPLWLET